MKRGVFLLFCLLASICVPAVAQQSECSLISDSLLRLHCFEGRKPTASVRGIIQNIADNPAIIVAIFASILAFLGTILGPIIQLKIGKRQVAVAKISADAAMHSARSAGFREIARMRLEWVGKLRDTLAEYHSILMSLDGSKQEEAAQKLSQLGTLLDLLLNQQDKTQKVLWDVADKIYNCTDIKERQAMDEELVAAGRAVLKAEWEKIKSEMRTAEFEAG